MAGATKTAGRCRFCLACSRRCEGRHRRCQRITGRMVYRSRQRSLPRSDVFSRWRLLLRFNRQSSPPGDRGGSRRWSSDPGYCLRLAPEHPFPAACDDVLTAWRFLRDQNIPAAHIAIGGDSAGAGLTLALIGRLRDAQENLPGCAWLISPWTDLTMSGPALSSRDAVDPLIHKEYLIELADAYLPAGMDRKDPRVSPLYADLKGFPPVIIQVGSAEALLDDATRFAAVAGAADVRVTLEIWPQMIHAWPLWNARLEPGRLALASAGAFIRQHL